MRNFFSSSMTHLFGLAILLMLFSSCKKEKEVLPDDRGNAGAELTDEKRMAALEAVEAKFASLNWQNRTEAYQQLSDFLHSRPEFEDSGLSDDNGNLWARFTDGELLIIAHNRQPTGNTPPDGGRRQTQESARIGLPASSTAFLMNSMGNYYTNGRTDMRVLGSIFGGKGYQVSKQQASIENLKKVQNEGVLYVSAHGGTGKLRNEKPVYGLWTTDSATVQNNKIYREELKKGNLCYFIAYHNQDRYGKPIPEKHYGVTSRFVKEHMSFSENALIYIDACSSATDADFINAFLEKTGNTGLFLGWTNPVGDEAAYQASKYFFDRTLGANDIYTQPESPKQRPFEPAVILAEMNRKNISIYRDPQHAGQEARLVAKDSPEHQTLLRPSIEHMQVDETQGKLLLVGRFGDDPGADKRSVTVNATEVAVQEWSHGLIICKIPVSGAGSAGDVVVNVGEHASNMRRLTSWEGQIKFTYPSEGSLMRTALLHIHLRADVGVFRTQPGETPKPFTEKPYRLVSTESFAKDSDVFYTVGGTGTSHFDDGCPSTMTIAWDYAQGYLPWTDPGIDATTTDKYFQSEVTLKRTGFECRVDIGARKVSEYTQTIKTCGNPAVMQFPLMYVDLPAPFKEFTLSFDTNFNIKPNKKEISLLGQTSLLHNAGQQPRFPVTLQWNAIQADFPPLANAAARTGFE